MSANAATNVTRTSVRKSYQTLYAVPEGGWSTISFEAELVEKYNYSTNEVAYSVNTKNYAMLSFYTSCDGGLYAGGTEGSNYHSIKINLR